VPHRKADANRLVNALSHLTPEQRTQVEAAVDRMLASKLARALRSSNLVPPKGKTMTPGAYILFVLIVGASSGTATTAEFKTKTACEAAAEQIRATIAARSRDVGVLTTCVAQA
jgi:hypothetical protein